MASCESQGSTGHGSRFIEDPATHKPACSAAELAFRRSRRSCWATGLPVASTADASMLWQEVGRCYSNQSNDAARGRLGRWSKTWSLKTSRLLPRPASCGFRLAGSVGSSAQRHRSCLYAFLVYFPNIFSSSKLLYAPVAFPSCGLFRSG